ncbi:hypothetical protein MHEI_21830 [Mycobacterium heidelbergense]|nr:hypothetical protein MHEI_21830 [Mycobacterium heidelbergense]
MERLGLVRPVVRPGVRPGLVKPGLAKLGLVKPGLVKPGLVKPGLVKPGLVKPEVPVPVPLKAGTGGRLIPNCDSPWDNAPISSPGRSLMTAARLNS